MARKLAYPYKPQKFQDIRACVYEEIHDILVWDYDMVFAGDKHFLYPSTGQPEEVEVEVDSNLRVQFLWRNMTLRTKHDITRLLDYTKHRYPFVKGFYEVFTTLESLAYSRSDCHFNIHPQPLATGDHRFARFLVKNLPSNFRAYHHGSNHWHISHDFRQARLMPLPDYIGNVSLQDHRPYLNIILRDTPSMEGVLSHTTPLGAQAGPMLRSQWQMDEKNLKLWYEQAKKDFG